MTAYKLSDAIRALGYEFLVTDDLISTPGGLGTPFPGIGARAYQQTDGRLGIAVKDDCWDYAYSAAHEIAEVQYGFQHTADMFCMQANILNWWVRRLACLPDDCRFTVDHSDGKLKPL